MGRSRPVRARSRSVGGVVDERPDSPKLQPGGLPQVLTPAGRYAAAGDPMKKLRRDAGLTLIEVLIAVTLLSMLTVGMAIAMRVGLSAFAKTDEKLMDNRRVAGAQRALQNELEGLMPVAVRCTGGGQAAGFQFPMLQADEDRLRLVSTFSLQQGWRGQPQILEMFV